jgi:hypothetical protein
VGENKVVDEQSTLFVEPPECNAPVNNSAKSCRWATHYFELQGSDPEFLKP